MKLYHDPISPNSRRVWITLLEKGLEFELVEVKLDVTVHRIPKRYREK